MNVQSFLKLTPEDVGHYVHVNVNPGALSVGNFKVHLVNLGPVRVTVGIDGFKKYEFEYVLIDGVKVPEEVLKILSGVMGTRERNLIHLFSGQKHDYMDLELQSLLQLAVWCTHYQHLSDDPVTMSVDLVEATTFTLCYDFGNFGKPYKDIKRDVEINVKDISKALGVSDDPSYIGKALRTYVWPLYGDKKDHTLFTHQPTNIDCLAAVLN